MRQFTVLFALVAAMGAAFASSSPVPNPGSAPVPADGFVDLLAGKEQQVFVPGPSTGDNAGLSLADALTLERKASLWWEYARDVASVVSPPLADVGEGACRTWMERLSMTWL